MPFWFSAVYTAPKPLFVFPALISFLLILSHGFITAAETNNRNKHMNIGAIIDNSSRIGKEVETAIKIAVQNVNNDISKNYKLSYHFRNPGKYALQAAYNAEELIKEKQVQVILGTEPWEKAVLVVDVGNRAEVPVLLLGAGATARPLTLLPRHFLVQMARDNAEQMRCVADIVRSYKWKRVIAIYEDDPYGGNSGMLDLLSKALQKVSSEIEYSLVLPPLSSLSDPGRFVRNELMTLLSNQSRVFIVLRSSLSLATHLFREAKEMGFIWRDSAWITTDSIADLLDSVDSSVISSMEGALGVKTYYSNTSSSFQKFSDQFRKIFPSDYPKENNSNPGIHALRAYDAITTITQAMERVTSNTSTSRMLLQNILSCNFTGLSGKIHFKGGELSHSPTFRIVNVDGKRYKELDFWSPRFGFSENLVVKDGENNNREALAGPVIWPGNPTGDPIGCAIPTNMPMKIGVPGRTSFEKFVKVEPIDNSDEKKYSGFCIDLFLEVLKILEENYTLPYVFKPFNGTYDELVQQVHNKTLDAVVGDVTILANRSEKNVEFTEPFMESGLLMIVPVKSDREEMVWMFREPFTIKMWVVTGAILLYTMFIVWFLEHQSNPAFRGPWKDQLGTALWFTFSSLFFSHRERIHSNFTRVVVVVWLFVVLVLNSSYTASLTSMLTVPAVKPNVTDINWLINSNSKVGCDGDSFVWKYLVDVLHFEPHNIVNISHQFDYPDEFKSGNISAAFLELPYEKVFINQYCKGYTVAGRTYRFGGLGFVFQKGSPIATDVSEAIITLSENGRLKELEEWWFAPSSECSGETAAQIESLGLQNFWGLYLISGAASTICFIIFLIQTLKNYRGHQVHVLDEDNITPS